MMSQSAPEQSRGNLRFCLVVAAVDALYVFCCLTSTEITVANHRIIVIFRVGFQKKRLVHIHPNGLNRPRARPRALWHQ